MKVLLMKGYDVVGIPGSVCADEIYTMFDAIIQGGTPKDPVIYSLTFACEMRLSTKETQVLGEALNNLLQLTVDEDDLRATLKRFKVKIGAEIKLDKCVLKY